MKENKIENNYPIQDGKYLNLENNRLYTNPRTINNYLNEIGITPIEYCIKWNLVNKQDYVECKICSKYTDSIGKHLSAAHKEYGGIEQYKKQFGEDIKIISDNYKQYLSNKITGENNHNHKSKTTELERQQKSPFSIEFWKLKYPNTNDNQINNILKIFRDSALSDREFDTRLEYYIKRGFTEEEGLKLLKERQTTFSLDICIEKYGEMKGQKRWKEKQDKWLNTITNNGNIFKGGHSKISQDLFNNLKNKLKNNNLKYATYNNELRLEYKDKYYFYDFTDLNNKKIIEFHGDIFHGNPSKYKANDTPNFKNKNILASDMWEKDKIKLECAHSHGYELLVIWESEYRFKGKNNKELVIKKCLDFINS